MKNDLNIEELFKEHLSSFEADVDPSVWNAVQSQISQGAASAGTGAATKTALSSIKTMVISGITLVSGVALGYVFFSDSAEENKPEQNTNTVSVVDDNATRSVEDVAEMTAVQADTFAMVVTSPNDPQKKEKIQVTVKEPVFTNRSIVERWLTPGSDRRTMQPNNNDEITESDSKKNNETRVDESQLLIEKQPKNENRPVAIIQLSAQAGPAPLTVDFSNLGDGSGCSWDFGDGNSVDGEIATHVYREPGNYVVKLTVRDKDGHTATDKVLVEVVQGSEVKVERFNTFTPNGDGYNDEFKLKGTNIQYFFMQVFTRNGKEVFRSNSIDQGWNGNDTQGKPMPEDVYLYVFKAMGTDGRVIPGKGEVTLQR